MSSPSSTNPFERFASGASVSSKALGSFHQVPTRPTETTRAKKIRTTLTPASASGAEYDSPRGLLEKYRSPGEPEWPLRLIIVGHNPSEKAWELGHYYANPSNRMWKLLSAAGIIPPDFVASDDNDCPVTCGVGFTDVGFSRPGTVSAEFKKTDLHAWREGFYDRFIAHAERAAATVVDATLAVDTASSAAVVTEGGTRNAADEAAQDERAAIEDGYPRAVAFAGKRQWEELFFDATAQEKAQTKGGKAGQFRFGLQPASLRPPGWPFPAQSTEVFVLPSSSGAAAMTNESRQGPYNALGDHMSRFGKWTRRRSNESASETPS